MENLYSEKEMFNFDENSRESGTVSEESKNNILEDNVSLTTSSTTYRGKTNIIEKSKKVKSQIQNKNNFEYNKHVSDNNNTINDTSRNTYSNHRISNSKNDQIQKRKKQG